MYWELVKEHWGTCLTLWVTIGMVLTYMSALLQKKIPYEVEIITIGDAVIFSLFGLMLIIPLFYGVILHLSRLWKNSPLLNKPLVK